MSERRGPEMYPTRMGEGSCNFCNGGQEKNRITVRSPGPCGLMVRICQECRDELAQAGRLPR